MGVNQINNKAVFLDRDGVINRSLVRNGLPIAPNSLDLFEIIPEAKESLNLLKKKGFLLIVVTNQPDVGRGILKKEIVEKMHNRLLNHLPLDYIYVCWHGYDGECICRKPLPGMLMKAKKDFKIDLKKSFIVGDRWRDVDTGHAAGCKTVFIDYNYKEKLNLDPDYKAKSIKNATEWILSTIT